MAKQGATDDVVREDESDEVTESVPTKELIVERKATITAPYRFTQDEKVELAEDLAAKTIERDNLEESKKNLTAQMKSQIDGVETEIVLLSQKISTGQEFREYYCRVEVNYTTGRKRYYDNQSGMLVKEEDLSAHDWQIKMDLDDNDEADAAPAADQETDPALTEGAFA